MKKLFDILVIVFFVFLILGCATAKPMGNPDVYLEKSLADIESNLSPVEAFKKDPEPFDSSRNEYYFRVATDVFLQIANGNIILSDGQGKEIPTTYRLSDNFKNIYRLSENKDFNPQKLYRVFLFLKTRDEHDYTNRQEIREITIENIEGLLTYNEAYQIAQKEEQKRKDADKLRRISDLDNAFDEVIESRNPDTIMRFLSSDIVADLPYEWDEKEEVYNYARLEIAKIITKNDNIELEQIFQTINPYAFDEDKVYFNTRLFVRQFLDRKIIVRLYPEHSPSDDGILLQNIPNLESIITQVPNVFMKYVGITTLRLANGGTKEIATFDVLYHY